jgi:hypothetical protein
VRYRGEREPELEEAGAIGQISPAGRTQGRVSAMTGLSHASSAFPITAFVSPRALPVRRKR